MHFLACLSCLLNGMAHPQSIPLHVIDLCSASSPSVTCLCARQALAQPEPSETLKLIACCRPGLQRLPSLPSKHALYLFFEELLAGHPDLVPPLTPSTPTSSIRFYNGPLQTGALVGADRCVQ